jgi:hypothetical protein
MSDSSASSDEVRIRLKHRDWEVEITSAERTIRQVVENVLSAIDTSVSIDPELTSQIEELRNRINVLSNELRAKSTVVEQGTNSANLGSKTTHRGGTTCRGLLQSLWAEGYFANERSLGIIHEELSRRGFSYDRTAVSHSLTDMVRENILIRKGTMRNYQYSQRISSVEVSQGQFTPSSF